MIRLRNLVGAAALALGVAALSGCGGDDNKALLGLLALDPASPSAQVGSINTNTANPRTNEAKGADADFPDEYCEIVFHNATSTNGKKYMVLVDFRQSDGVVVMATIDDLGSTWDVYEKNTTLAGVSGVSVNRSARTITFTQKTLNGEAGETATITGTTGAYPANLVNEACTK